MIGGPAWILCSRARLDGYRAAMDEVGVPVDPLLLISHGEFHVEEGIDPGRALLALADRPTAIFAGNDLQALGVYQAAREARLHIPEDLRASSGSTTCRSRSGSGRRSRRSVSRWSRWPSRPPSSSSRWPTGEAPAQARRELATELVVRESTAPPRA